MEIKLQPITDRQSAAISLIRSIAILIIFTCHVLQHYDNALAYWLSVGVEMFLFISGFLFGKQNILHWNDWFSKRAKRLFPDYYITLFFAFFLLFFLAGIRMPTEAIISYLTATKDYFDIEISGLGHLWYISCILLCYLMTPLLQLIRNRFSLRKNIFFHLIILPLLLLILTYLLHILPFRYSMDVWIFSLGYLVPSLFPHSVPKPFIIFIVVLTFAFSFLRGLLELSNYFYIALLTIIGKGIVIPVSKVMFSFSLCLILIYTLRINRNLIINFLDKYSYNIYLVHAVFILGPLSVLNLYLSPIVKLLVLATLSLLSSIAVKRLSDLMRSLLP